MLYLICMLLVVSLGSYLQSLSFSWGLLASEVLLILAPALIFLKPDMQPQGIRLSFKRINLLIALACLLGGVGLWLFDSMLEAVLVGITGYSPPMGLEVLPASPLQAAASVPRSEVCHI